MSDHPLTCLCCVCRGKRGEYSGPDNPMFGRHHSQESRKRMRAKLLGCKKAPFTLEHCSRISKGLMGHSVSENVRKELSNWRHTNPHPKGMLGKHHTKEWGEKHSLDLSGQNCHWWQGGISNEPYGAGFNRKLQEQIRDRDGHLCQFPGCYLPENGKKHPIHHINYVKNHNEEVNLITLCNSHHAKVNTNREHWTEVFQEVQCVRGIEV